MYAINEGDTKETDKGREHKGTYGSRHGKEDVRDQYGHKIGRVDKDKDDNAKKDDAPKKRGRPTKAAKDETGADIKHDTSGIQAMLGGKPKNEVGKKSVKHSLKEYIEEVETNQQLDEAEQLEIKPASSTNTQVIQQGNKTLGTVSNPQLAQQIKQSIGKGEMTLSTDDQAMAEGSYHSNINMDDWLRTASPKDLWDEASKWESSTEYIGREVEKLIDRQKELLGPAGYREKQINDRLKAKLAPSVTYTDRPGQYKRHYKQGYPKISVPMKEARLAQTLSKMHESLQATGVVLTEGELKQTMIKFFDELELGPKGYNIKPAMELHDKGLAANIINKTLSHGRFKGMSGTFKDQLRDAALEHFGFTNYDESLEEADLVPHPSKDLHTTHGMNSKLGDTNAFKPSSIQTPNKPVAEPTPWKVDPINAATDRAINFISGLGKSKSKLESTEMKDIQLESWEKELNNLLNEGITVSTSTGQQGAPDSVSINATDNDANELLNILRQSGMGVFGGNDKPMMTPYGVTSQGEEEPTGTGTQPEMSPNVVGDGDDMMSLIKKMSGLSAGPVGQEPESDASSDYEDEEGSDDTSLEPADDSQEQDSQEQDSEEDSEEEQTDEGIFNTVKNAVGLGKKPPATTAEKNAAFHAANKGRNMPSSGNALDDYDYFTGRDKVLGGEKTDEGNAFGQEVRQKKSDNIPDSQQRIKTGGQNLPVKEEHGHENCNECGYAMESCECEDQVEEGFSNDAGGDAMGDTELMKLKEILSMGGDLHRMKSNQTVGNPTQVSMRESIKESLNQWKKLSGIK